LRPSGPISSSASRYTTTKLKKKFTAYNDPFGSSKWSVWEGSWVTINP
jgi:hypothetical protein